MPELPDVEHWRRYAARHATGRRVRAVRVSDDSVLRNRSPQALGRALHGRRLRGARRRGKWLLLDASPGVLVIHFGMTGSLAWTGRPERHPPDPHDCVRLEMDGGELRYRTQRKLGGLWWARSEDEVVSITGDLGPDAAGISEEDFDSRLSGRRGGIKSALMDQSVISGLGNELSDEILWRARIAPDVPVAELGASDLRRIHRALRRVLRSALRHGRIPRRKGWLQSIRSGPAGSIGSDRDEVRCPRCGRATRRDRVAGRTALWCPHCQDAGSKTAST